MKIYDRVKSILERYPQARNSDNVCEWIYLGELGYITNGVITKENFLKCPPLESVRRARQKVQEQHPRLQAADTVKQIRQEKEKQFPKWIFDDETNTARMV